MSSTITIRISKEQAEWLDETARQTGRPKGSIVRDELDKARQASPRRFLRHAGRIEGKPGLSSRKGFSRNRHGSILP